MRKDRSFRATLRGVMRFAQRKPLGAVSGVLAGMVVLTAIIGPYVAPYDPLFPDIPARLSAPSFLHWMGTDELGRDVFSRVLVGARSAIFVGVSAIILGTLVGAALGLTSAYIGGWFDLIFQRFIDGMQSIPLLVLALVIVAMLGSSIFNVILALSAILIPRDARLIRGVTMAVMTEVYIDAARAIGCTPIRVMVQHIFPQTVAPVLVVAGYYLGAAIMVEASLSFLGVGTPPPTPTWGGMLSGAGRKYMETAVWIAIFPGIAISLTVMSFNLLGDAVRDVLDPRMRGS
jgi:peptide/nickel transport system permease protein